VNAATQGRECVHQASVRGDQLAAPLHRKSYVVSVEDASIVLKGQSDRRWREFDQWDGGHWHGHLLRAGQRGEGFDLGHSLTLTLTLAALDLLSPPARLIVPLIALTIIVVGAANLFVLGTQAKGGRENKDIRAFLAAGFGLIHGFGFAFVLKEFGLPQEALAWSLLASIVPEAKPAAAYFEKAFTASRTFSA